MGLTFFAITTACLATGALGAYSIKRPAVADSGSFGAVLITAAVLVWVGALVVQTR